MKRQITTEKGASIKSPRSPRGIENELADMIEFMVAQMAKRFQNQVLGQLQARTVDKFADSSVAAAYAFSRRGDRVIHSGGESYNFADAQTGNFASILLRLAKSAKKSILKQFSNGRLESISQSVLAKLDKKTKREFYERVAGKTGIDVTSLIASEGMKSTTNALVAETAQWIQTLRDDTFQRFTNNTLFAMSQGESLDTIVGSFDTIVKERKNHAKFLARNQVQNYNSITTKIRAQNLGITEAVWETAGDERVRPSHRDRDGKTFKLAEGLYSSLDSIHLLPGVDYNCFPGDSQLNHTSLVHKLYRRRYAGELLSFVFDDGVILKTTPNHPILTANGFKAAHLISAGDDVVRRLDEGIDTAELYGNRSIPTFEQIHTALNLLGVEHGVSPSISGKFHGDVSDGEVEVIAFDSLLMREVDASIRKKLGELDLTVADQVFILAGMTCNRDTIPVLGGLGLSSDRIVRALDLCRALIIRHLSPLECFRFALGAWGDSLIDKAPTDDLATHAKTFGDCIFAFSVLVHGRDLLIRKLNACDGSGVAGSSNAKLVKMTTELNVTNPSILAGGGDSHAASHKLGRIIEKSSANYLGHIYNLQTDTGDYITNTTAVSNCRCSYTLIIPETAEG